MSKVVQGVEVPIGEIEVALARVWSELLGVDEIDRRDDFFEIGGHSLQAARVANRLRDLLNVDISVDLVFTYPVLADFAGEIARADCSGQAAIGIVPRNGTLPLSSAQERLWFLERLEGSSPAYNIPWVIRLRGTLDVEVLRRTLDRLFARHDALRSVFVTEQGEPRVELLDAELGLPLSVRDLVGSADPEAEAARLSAEEAARPFDLARGPLIRSQLIRLAEDDHLFLLTMHHIVSDGWSMTVLLGELKALYGAFLKGEDDPLPPLTVQYPDYAAWQRQWLSGERLETQAGYWRKALAGAPVQLELPTDRPRPAERTFAGAYLPIALEAELTLSLKRLAQRHGSTLFMVLLTAWAGVLARLSGQDEVVIGSASANRGRREVEGLIGFFVNTLALRVDLSGDPTLADLLARARRVALEAQDNQDLPFEQVVEIVQPPRRLNHSPVFQVIFAWQNNERERLELPGLKAQGQAGALGQVKFDLDLSLSEQDGRIVGGLGYATALFDAATMERHVGYLTRLLEAIAADDQQRVGGVDLLDTAERTLLLETWNQTATAYPEQLCIHQLIEEKVRLNPEAAAVICEDQTLSYGELNARANRLAHHLIGLGVRPDDRVAICVERSLEMVVGLMAILKAGGAYVPLDPAYPSARLALMLRDSDPKLVLSHAQAREVLDKALVDLEAAPPIVDLVADAPAWAGRADANPDPATLGLTSRNLAYVIYTSGSTGAPKGAQNEHRALLNRLDWMQQAYGLGADDRILQKTPFSFDVSVWEFFWPLRQGAGLVMAPPGAHREPQQLVSLIVRHAVTTLHFVPSMLSSFLGAEGLERCRTLRRIVCSGEALPAASVQRCQALIPQAELHNLYGPTEAAIDVTAWTAPPHYEGKVVPIGRPIANTRIYILDGSLQPVPLGATGEIHIGGAGVARGYLNRPDLTAERFIPSPFVEGDRLYKTGDLGRYLPDGDIEFLGRNDHQVKIRGFRIELGEIEARLVEHPAVREAVVLAREDDAGDKRLVAYVTGEADLHEEREGLLEFRSGLRVRGANQHETLALHEEIFVDETYRINGLQLPTGACVLDVGANIGLFSLYVKGIEPTSTVIAFEPIRTTFELLQANTAAYKTDVIAKPFGISDRNGTAIFRHYPEMSVNSGRYADPDVELATTRTYLENQSGSDGRAFDTILEERFAYEEQECELRTISDVLRSEQISSVDLLKIDAEKSELDVLNGIEDADWEKISQVVVEVHDIDGRLQLITDILSDRGFDVVAVQKAALANTGLFNLFARRPYKGARPAQLPSWSFERLTAARPTISAGALRAHLEVALPSYMVPAAYVRLDTLPLTPNGKLDRKALPDPTDRAFGGRTYQAPQGEVEETLAEIWSELLNVRRVGRHDDFFQLGGHSLLAVRMTDRLRSANLGVEVRNLFATPTLSGLAATLAALRQTTIPPNLIDADTIEITPDKLPLVELTQADIDELVRQTPGGISNIQDIYALSPLQEGLLFHHLLDGEGDPYLMIGQRAFAHRDVLDRYLSIVQRVVDRHDILRTSFHWKGMTTPAQVVRRRAELVITEVTLDPDGGPAIEQLRRRFDPRYHRIDLSVPPLLRFVTAFDAEHERWILTVLLHHLVGDHTTLEVLNEEVLALLRNPDADLPAAHPFRNLIAQIRNGTPATEHERFFREELGDIESPTAPFGLSNVRGNGAEVSESHRRLPEEMNVRLRRQARRLGVSVASLCHLAWGKVIAEASGSEDVVFGTVLFGRMDAGEGADRAMGPFINTLPLRLRLDGTSVDESARRTHARLGDLLRHEHASLALAQRCTSLEAETPLFSALLNYRHNAPSKVVDSDGITASLGSEERANYPLILSVEDFGQDLGLTAQAAHPLSSEQVCSYMQQALVSLVEALENQPHACVRSLEILPPSERTLLLETWNQTATAYPEQLCIHQLIEEKVRLNPEAAAVICEDQTLSYGELNARANRLAHHLIGLGVRPDDRVAICVERSLEMVVGLMAILKAGGAYVPLDPAYPSARLALMLRDSDPKLVLSHAQAREVLDKALVDLEAAPPIVDLVADAPAWAGRADANPDPATLGLTSRNLAYVIYTSGSTGAPKGVMVEHRSVVRLTQNNLFLAISPEDVFLASSSATFDAATLELWGPLLNGARLVLYPETRIDTASLARTINAHGVTVAWMTARLFDHFEQTVAERCPSLTCLMVGGEVVLPASVQGFYARHEGVRLVNGYGPTENTTFSVTYLIPRDLDVDRPIPIGKPIGNSSAYILDASLQPVPRGAIGEIYVGGAGVARGYLNRPDLTAERFIPSPFVEGDRLYKTGDLGRYLPDGDIEFLGRNDHQVKIRGFRIELGEIEARLVEHPAVREAVVLAREDEDGDKRLVAYVTGETDPEALRSHLQASLPEYMVPAAYVQLEVLPLTPNGKLDRAALPAPDGSAFARRAYEAPQGEIEEALAKIWSAVLGVTNISRHDNFFELGGHSLMAVRMINRLQIETAALLPLASLFAHPVLSNLALQLSKLHRRDSASIAVTSRDKPLSLSFAQERLWFLDQFGGSGAAYNIPRVIRLRGTLDVEVLRRTLDRLFARHDALRSVFVTEQGEPRVELLDAELGLPLSVRDLVGSADPEAEAARLSAEEAARPFDLARGPLIRSQLIRLAEDDHLFLLTMHHIVSDGWSMTVLLGELKALYGAFLKGEDDPLPPLTVQYPDYAAWQRQWLSGERLETQAGYWRKALAGAPVQLELPTDRPRPAERTFAGAYLPIALEAELTLSLKRLAQRHGSTLFMVLLTAWAGVLARLSGQDEVVIGSLSANRGRREVEGLIGFFVNTLALRVDLSGDPTLADLLARARRVALEAQDNQDLPFEQVVEIVQPPRRLNHSPVFQVIFAWQNNERERLELPGLKAQGQAGALGQVKFDLDLSLSEQDGRIVGGLGYATALFDAATMERHVGYLTRLLEAIAADDQQRVGGVDLLDTAERTLLLETWNQTATAYPEQLCIHQLIEEKVRLNPEAAAVICEDQTLSYGELNARANRLAHHLIGLGVRPDDRVAICVERSLEMVVGLMAILKAGGAYVPLDPAYPSARLALMLRDSDPKLVLSHAQAREVLDKALVDLEAAPPIVDLVADAPAWAGRADANPDPATLGLTSRNLAYVIYTSGSTGAPKGAQNEHRALLNRLDWMQQAYGLGADDRILQKTPFSFDVSVWEFFWPLRQGAGLVMAPPGAHREPQQLVSLIVRHAVTTLHFVPSMLSSFLGAEGLERCRTLRRIVCSGEALPAASVQRCQALIPQAELHNLYGPTEAAIDVTAWTAPPHYEGKVVPIGRPIANTRIYILDGSLQPVPLGATGEIHIGGAGVARGYLNRPDLTAERFIPSPFVEGDRLYKTGDLGRYLPDGDIEFLGRNDHQVKIRGFRIELGEIEARLVEHPAVREAVVLAREDDAGDKRLVAYYTSVAAGGGDAEALRAHLQASLPEYMVPAAYVRLDALPLTPNGKLDRASLPAPDGSAFARRAYEAPQGEIEQALAKIWSTVLGVANISRHDNFFELGGHSLLAVRMINQVESEIGARIPLSALFDTQSLMSLAELILISAIIDKCGTDEGA